MIGRLSQVLDRWIYTACLCFGLDFAEQARSCFSYPYSVYQVEYSRNLILASGAVMERAFDTIVDRTRKRLDVPRLRTLFGVGRRPRHRDADLSPRQAVVIERLPIAADGREARIHNPVPPAAVPCLPNDEPLRRKQFGHRAQTRRQCSACRPRRSRDGDWRTSGGRRDSMIRRKFISSVSA